MTSIDWRAVGALDPRKLGEARHQAHNAAQWLARMARSYIEPAPDDGHTALEWLAEDDAFVTREIRPGLVLELRLPELTLQFKEEGERVTHELRMDERSPAEVEAWLLVELLHRHVDREKLSKDLPYKLPGMIIGDAVKFNQHDTEDGLRELARWYANGAAALAEACRTNGGASERSAVKCWPHHFDLVAVVPPLSGEATSVRVGLNPGDGHYGEPYFYVIAEPPLAGTGLAALPEIGHWHSKDFVAAVLPASVIVERKLSGEDVVAFLRDAIAAVRASAAA